MPLKIAKKADAKKPEATPSSEDTREFCALLNNMDVDNMGAPPKVFYCHDTDSTLDVLQRLVQNNISSMPVVEDRGDDSKVLNFIDVLDIAYYIAELAAETQNIPVHYSSPMNDLRLKDTPVGEVLAKSGRAYHQMSDFLTTALDVVHGIVTHRMRRVLVTASNGEMKTVVTQSTVARIVHDNFKLLEKHSARTLEQLGLCQRKPATVNETANAINALKMMAYEHHSCVGVVNDDGKLTGVISARDLRAIFMSKDLRYEIKELYDKLPAFLVKVRSGPDAVTHNFTKTLKPTATFKDAIDAFVESKLHHIFIVNDSHKPVSVVTLTDLLGTLVMTSALIT